MNAVTHYQNPLTSLVDTVLSEGYSSPSRSFHPPVDIHEDTDTYHILMDVPGLNKNDITITAERGILTISGERKDESASRKTSGYHYAERARGEFRREFRLPEDVDSSHISASMDAGVLSITLQKEEEKKPRQIQIK
ncbi:MAG: Hsp20/alpha crystallin family protein [Fibrobacterota bacterium]